MTVSPADRWYVHMHIPGAVHRLSNLKKKKKKIAINKIIEFFFESGGGDVRKNNSLSEAPGAVTCLRFTGAVSQAREYVRS